MTQLGLSFAPPTGDLDPPLPEMVLCISLWQPYAGLCVAGIKTLETRTWDWPYPVPSWLVIHAAQHVDRAAERRLAEKVARVPVAFAEHFNINKELGGLCHFAALGLVEALRTDGLHAVVASTGGHSWASVLLEGGLSPILVDVTATQFGLAPVYVRLPWQRPHALYEVRIKGTPCAIEAQKAADSVIKRAPANWWAIPPWELPAALKRAGTRLTECGERVLTQTVVAPLKARQRAVWRAQFMREMDG